MRDHRFIATMLSALMLHLTLVGADWTCARHGGKSGTAAMSAMSHQTRALLFDAGPAAAESSNRPCETPTQAECCRAMTSCAVTFGVSDELHPSSAPVLRESIRPRAATAPASLIIAPDPPPPKA